MSEPTITVQDVFRMGYEATAGLRSRVEELSAVNEELVATLSRLVMATGALLSADDDEGDVLNKPHEVARALLTRIKGGNK